MKREELSELHYITPISNLPSIYVRGLLSHNKVKRVEHESVAMPEIQERRAKVAVAGGRPLHDYVNLYFHARNPMMYVRRLNHMNLCVLRVGTGVLDLPGVVVTDCNASSDYVRFAPAPKGLSIVDPELVFAEYWTHPDLDLIEAYRRKSARCAEVLVPDRVDQRYILGVYVSRPESQNVVTRSLAGVVPQVQVVVDGHLFFQ